MQYDLFFELCVLSNKEASSGLYLGVGGTTQPIFFLHYIEDNIFTTPKTGKKMVLGATKKGGMLIIQDGRRFRSKNSL